ncbi:MAG TPA: DUF2254 domain-containing protein [Longimicrobiaceae bacterium]|nr:DUF2254 domain-containing protein [Longimicrobiaceae bacterium]
MRAWFKNLWSAVRDSLWFLPGVFTLVAAALAAALMALERQGRLWSGEEPGWLYQGGAEGARAVLNVITGSLITVTGVVFSVVIVAVQLASSQYTPRVLRNFTSDRGNQVVLGIFIGTFTYAVLVLRTVRSSDADAEPFVPRLAVTVAVALLLVSVAALIYFINHVAREIHVTAILDRISRETMGNVHQLFPEHIGRADEAPPPDPRKPEHDSVRVCARQAGYLQVVDQDSLFELGEKKQVVIGMEPKIGEYVLQGRPLASVWTEGRLGEELEQAIRKAFVLGPERTPEQDVEFGMIQISDIAIKSLSPSVNDPTTAIRCIDRLSEILAEFGTRNPPEPRRTRDGVVRFVASYTTFDAAVKVAYDDIRHFGASIPLVAEHLLEVLSELVTLVPAERRQPLVSQAQAVLYTARQEIENPRDREAVEQKAESLSRRVGFDVGTGTLT